MGFKRRTTERKAKHTLLGDVLCNEREKLPIYTKERLAQADLFLYQVFNAMNLTMGKDSWRWDTYWFPTLYVYTSEGVSEWKKLKSVKHCEKVFPLFNVNNIDELKKAIEKCVKEREMKYSGDFYRAFAILNCVKLEEIGTIN